MSRLARAALACALLAGCGVPAETFLCGSLECKVNLEYCRTSPADAGGGSDVFTCVPVPPTCGPAVTCACLQGEPCSAWCTTKDEAVTVTCPAD